MDENPGPTFRYFARSALWKCEDVLVSGEELCDKSEPTECREPGVLDEPERLHVAYNAGNSSLEEVQLVVQLQRHGVVHGAV